MFVYRAVNIIRKQIANSNAIFLFGAKAALLMLFFIPFIVVTSIDPLASSAVRVVVLFVAVDILALFWVFCAWKKWLPLPRVNGAVASALLFLVVLFVLSFFSVDQTVSLFGTRDRMSGMLLYVHILAFSFLLTAFFAGSFRGVKGFPAPNSFRAFFPIACAALLASFGIALSAIFEYARVLAYSPKNWVGGLIGNPSLLSGYLLPGIFLSLLLVFHAGSPRWFRFFSAGACFAILFAIVLTDTLSALAGVVIGATGFVFIIGFGNRLERMGKTMLSALFLLMAGLVAAGGLFFFSARATIDFQALGPRFAVWPVALRAFAEHPFTGIGDENFAYAFDRNYDPSFIRFGIGETLFDKPHNAYLEILAESGIIGAAVVLLFTVAVARAFFALVPSDRVLAAAGFGALLAQSAFNVFLFDTPWSLLAFAPFYALAFLPERPAVYLPLPLVSGTQKNMFRIFSFAIGIGVVTALLASSVAAFQREAEWRMLRQKPFAEELSDARQVTRFTSFLQRQGPWQRDYRLTLSDALAMHVLRGGGKERADAYEAIFGQSLKGFDHGSTRALNARTRWQLGRIFSARGILTHEDEWFREARAQYEAAYALNAQRQGTLLEFAIFEARMGHIDRARGLFHEAAFADGGSVRGKWDAGYEFLSGLVRQRLETDAPSVFRDSLSLLASLLEEDASRTVLFPADELHFVGQAFAVAGDFERASFFASQASTKAPYVEKYRTDALRFKAMAEKRSRTP